MDDIWDGTLTDVILANVNTFNTSSQSYIYSVVDEKGNIRRLCYSMESLSNADLLSSVAGLVTQLYNCDAYKEVRSGAAGCLWLMFSDLLLRQREQLGQYPCRREWRECCQSPGRQSNLRAY